MCVYGLSAVKKWNAAFDIATANNNNNNNNNTTFTGKGTDTTYCVCVCVYDRERERDSLCQNSEDKISDVISPAGDAMKWGPR